LYFCANIAIVKRIVFVFGTLYVDDVIEALLGSIPIYFHASLAGFGIYKGEFNQVPEAAQNKLRDRVDVDSFSFLFAKPIESQTIDGRVYEVNLEQEMILDHWEVYPDWYRKRAVSVQYDDGESHEAFIYTIDSEGILLEHFERVVNDLEGVIKNAKDARQRVIEKFPEAFS
jgi:gamma-glutamylcyclotransferase (GGCT)/AIG2-like uncharacterized protein YtfP